MYFVRRTNRPAELDRRDAPAARREFLRAAGNVWNPTPDEAVYPTRSILGVGNARWR